MTLKRTPCCALLFMTAKNYDSLDLMYKKLKNKKNQLNQITWHGYGRGETTVQCIVLQSEIVLRKNLKKLGFKKKFIFDRRKISNSGYVESNKAISHTQLTMYTLELKNLKDIKL